jgi:hypothetical protein
LFIVQAHGAVDGQQGKGGGDGIDGEEVGQLNLQHGEGRQRRRQQPAAPTVQPLADEKESSSTEATSDRAASARPTWAKPGR